MPSNDTWWRRWSFGLALGGLMALLEMLALASVIIMTPEGKTWLGSLILNSADYAVYLSYLSQGAHGFLLDNLYNNLAQTPRFDLFWSLGGVLVRIGLSAIQTHELLRWSNTLFLGMAIYATAKALTKTERMARLASCLIASGMGLGWLYALAANLVTGLLLPVVPPDISTQFSIVPILFGGAHMILSVALQMLILRWIWEVVLRGERRPRPWLLVAVFFFTGFHPYYIALIGLFSVIVLAIAANKHGDLKRRFGDFLIINLVMLPSFLYFAWLAYQDQAFRQHFLVVNRLALHQPIFWLICLIPFFVAAYFMLTKKVPEGYRWSAKPCWAYAWIFSALLCMLLPLPWTNKYAQGLLPALVMTTLPFWLWLSDRWLGWKAVRPANVWRKVSYALFLCAPFFYLLSVQTLLTRTEMNMIFYQPDGLFQAWNILRDQSPKDSLILVDDEERALWTPAYALRTVWVGHGHESPDYLARIEQYKKWLATEDRDEFNGFLGTNRITQVIATKPENQTKFEKLMDKTEWHIVLEKDSVTLWSKD